MLVLEVFVMRLKQAAPAIGLILAFGFASAAVAQNRTRSDADQGASTQLQQADKQFLDHAVMAEKHARSLAVKAFSRLMIDDHAAIESRLAMLADQLNINLPSGETDEDRQAMNRLENISGADFDREFMDAQIKDHRKDVEDFKHQQQAASAQRAKSFAEETLPLLQQHLALAEAVRNSLGQESTGTSQATGSSGRNGSR
jgi:putative membrane protein